MKALTLAALACALTWTAQPAFAASPPGGSKAPTITQSLDTD